jgi:type I restriction enzyme, S subunit
MSFPRYPKYKDSGVEWLGEVPEHWEVRRLKQICHVFPSNVDKKSVEGEAAVLLCNYTDVYYNDRIVADMDFMPATATDDQIAKFTLRAGDTIITKDSETADDIAVAAYVPHGLPGVVCGYHLSMVRPRVNTNGAFVKRLFDSTYAKSCFAVRANGLTRVGLSQYELDNVEMPVPPPTEQALIAAFLDRDTAKIDVLIAEQQRLIELLQEKRQAVISHAVTKGLNPDAPMKDSGIEWLDVIPAHWRAVPVKHLAAPGVKTFTDGDWIESPYITEEGVRLIQTGNVGIGVYKEQGFRYVTHETYESLRCTEVKPHDVLICRLDGPVGRACLAPDLGVRMITSVDNAILKVSPHASAAFVVALMSSLPWLSWIDALCRVGGGFRLRVSRGQLGELRVPLPPRAEQDAIMDRISSHTESCNALADRAVRAISLLQERRSALISAAVTGQIDVRGLAGAEAA